MFTAIRSTRIALIVAGAVIALAGSVANATVVYEDDFVGPNVGLDTFGNWVMVRGGGTDNRYSGVGDAVWQTSGFGPGPEKGTATTVSFDTQPSLITVTEEFNPRQANFGSATPARNYISLVSDTTTSANFLRFAIDRTGNITLNWSGGSANIGAVSGGYVDNKTATIVTKFINGHASIDFTWASGGFSSGDIDLATVLPGFNYSTLGTTTHLYLGGDGYTHSVGHITIDSVPAPASASLLGLGGLVAARRRRTA